MMIGSGIWRFSFLKNWDEQATVCIYKDLPKNNRHERAAGKTETSLARVAII